MVNRCQFIPLGSARPLLSLSACFWRGEESPELLLFAVGETHLGAGTCGASAVQSPPLLRLASSSRPAWFNQEVVGTAKRRAGMWPELNSGRHRKRRQLRLCCLLLGQGPGCGVCTLAALSPSRGRVTQTCLSPLPAAPSLLVCPSRGNGAALPLPSSQPQQRAGPAAPGAGTIPSAGLRNLPSFLGLGG